MISIRDPDILEPPLRKPGAVLESLTWNTLTLATPSLANKGAKLSRKRPTRMQAWAMPVRTNGFERTCLNKVIMQTIQVAQFHGTGNILMTHICVANQAIQWIFCMLYMAATPITTCLWNLLQYLSGQLTMFPKPHLRAFGGIPILNHHLGWPRLRLL